MVYAELAEDLGGKGVISAFLPLWAEEACFLMVQLQVPLLLDSL